MSKQERVTGTGCETVFGSDVRGELMFEVRFDHLDAPVFMPAGSCVKLELDGEESVSAINVVMRGDTWK